LHGAYTPMQDGAEPAWLPVHFCACHVI